MHIRTFSAFAGTALCLLLFPATSPSQTGSAVRVRETLDRGVHAQHLGNNAAYISWRLLETDGVNTTFNIYRTMAGGSPVKRNASPVATTTDFLDTGATNGIDIFYEVRPVVNGREGLGSTPVKVNSSSTNNYVSINVGSSVGKIGIGDLDGDGKYDFVVRKPQGSIDPAGPYDGTGPWHASTGTYQLKAYKSDGTALWTYDMGWNIEAGIWYSPFVVYDFDGDGKAEVALKTAPTPGTRTNERVTTKLEYLTILNGVDKQVKAQADWPNQDYFASYNHYSRNQIGVAYLDGKTPCIIAARGTYGVMKARAFIFTGNALVQKWDWMSPLDANGHPISPYGAGSHSMRAADVDGDGKDEVVLGAVTLDDGEGYPGGKVLWYSFSKHPDHVYVGDIDPNRPGLEAYHGYEDGCSTRGWSLWDAKTGALIWGSDSYTWHLHGSGLVSDLNPQYPGMEAWSAEKDQPYTYFHSATKVSLDHKGLFFTGNVSYKAVYWDADLQREAIELNTVYDYPSQPVSVLHKNCSHPTGTPHGS